MTLQSLKAIPYKNLINIVEEYPVSKNNEQGIMNLYFIFEKICFSL